MERDAVERADVEREPLEREPLDRELLERLVLRPEPVDEFAFVNATRSLSKSLSACLLVRAALRRSAASAVVTSL